MGGDPEIKYLSEKWPKRKTLNSCLFQIKLRNTIIEEAS